MTLGSVPSRTDADVVVSTGFLRVAPGSSISVSVLLVELEELLFDAPESNNWRVAGRVHVPGAWTSLDPEQDFCRGRSIVRVWNETPAWNGTELCFGKFQSKTKDRFFHYYFVAVVSESR